MMGYTVKEIDEQIKILNDAHDVAVSAIASATALSSAHALRFISAIDKATSEERRNLENMREVAHWHEQQLTPAGEE